LGFLLDFPCTIVRIRNSFDRKVEEESGREVTASG
jgi:hypothetical protein